MANKSVIMASSFTGEAFESIYVDVSDSDSWQVIDPSDSDDGEDFSYGDVTATDDEGSSDSDDVVQQRFGSPSSDISMQSLADEISHHCQVLQTIDDNDAVLKDDVEDEYDPYESEEEEDDDDDDDLDLDDELVPKWLNNKFERQRIRKLGKKVNPKMKKSKRLVCQYNKPGCVHGKHGLGMKHNLIW